MKLHNFSVLVFDIKLINTACQIENFQTWQSDTIETQTLHYKVGIVLS